MVILVIKVMVWIGSENSPFYKIIIFKYLCFDSDINNRKIYNETKTIVNGGAVSRIGWS